MCARDRNKLLLRMLQAPLQTTSGFATGLQAWGLGLVASSPLFSILFSLVARRPARKVSNYNKAITTIVAIAIVIVAVIVIVIIMGIIIIFFFLCCRLRLGIRLQGFTFTMRIVYISSYCFLGCCSDHDCCAFHVMFVVNRRAKGWHVRVPAYE